MEKVTQTASQKIDGCCPKLMKAPFVCNGCAKRNHSNRPYLRRIYYTQHAQKEEAKCVVLFENAYSTFDLNGAVDYGAKHLHR